MPRTFLGAGTRYPHCLARSAVPLREAKPGFRLLVALVLLLLPIATPIVAQDHPYALADRVDAKVQTEIKRQEIAGLAVVVIDDAKIT